MNPAIREAIAAGDAACACESCACSIDGQGDAWTACSYCSPSHAAIRNLARVVLEEAGYQTSDLSDRARIRALMPEEVKQK